MSSYEAFWGGGEVQKDADPVIIVAHSQHDSWIPSNANLCTCFPIEVSQRSVEHVAVWLRLREQMRAMAASMTLSFSHAPLRKHKKSVASSWHCGGSSGSDADVAKVMRLRYRPTAKDCGQLRQTKRLAGAASSPEVQKCCWRAAEQCCGGCATGGP